MRARAKKLFDRDARTWAAEQQTDVVLDVRCIRRQSARRCATSNRYDGGSTPGAD
jgi:hypothetical protein